jgi:hypothetical protein
VIAVGNDRRIGACEAIRGVVSGAAALAMENVGRQISRYGMFVGVARTTLEIRSEKIGTRFSSKRRLRGRRQDRQTGAQDKHQSASPPRPCGRTVFEQTAILP